MSSPPQPLSDSEEVASRLKAAARSLGFDLVGIAPAVGPSTTAEFRKWLDAGFAGEMHYLDRRREAYEHPRSMLGTVRSAVMLGVNYYGGEEAEIGPGEGRVARYARIPSDYHDVLRDRLKQLAGVLHELRPGCRSRGVVDTAPLLERDFARRAGLGWFGKNTMLLNKRIGSWFFLAALLTDVELPADAPHETAHCGTCTRCLDACPTDAFVEPYVLDARKCISYLTIELGPRPIDPGLEAKMKDWAFGCDVCQEVCPWNSKAPIARDPEFRASPEGRTLRLLDLVSLGEAGFQERYRSTPLARTGYEALVRNACISIGHSGTAEDVAALRAAVELPSRLIRDAAARAEERLRDRQGSGSEGAGVDDCRDLSAKSGGVQTG